MQLRTSHAMFNRTYLYLFLCVFTSFTVVSANEDPKKWYEIEVILFSTITPDNFESETWQIDPGHPNLKNNIALYSPAEFLLEEYPENITHYLIEAEFEDDNKNTFKKYVSKLARSSKYQLLLHRAWRQPVDKKAVSLIDKPDTAPVFDIEHLSPNQETPEFVEEQSPEEQLFAALLKEETEEFQQPAYVMREWDPIEAFDDVPVIPTSQPTILSYEGPPQHLVYGNTTLNKGRYLHLSVDFLFRGEPYTPTPEEIPLIGALGAEMFLDNPVNTNTAEKMDDTETVGEIPAVDIPPPITGFRIKDSKRVRLNQIYYFDHPLFGAIVRVIRYTPPKI